MQANVASWESKWFLMAGATLAGLWGGRGRRPKRGWRGQGTKGLSAGRRSLNSLLARSSEGSFEDFKGSGVFGKERWPSRGGDTNVEQDKSEAVPMVRATGAEAGNGRSSGQRRRRPVEGTALG